MAAPILKGFGNRPSRDQRQSVAALTGIFPGLSGVLARSFIRITRCDIRPHFLKFRITVMQWGYSKGQGGNLKTGNIPGRPLIEEPGISTGNRPGNLSTAQAVDVGVFLLFGRSNQILANCLLIVGLLAVCLELLHQVRDAAR